MYTPEGVSSVANIITAYEESQYNRDSHFLICNVFFVSKGNLFLTFILYMYRELNGSVIEEHSPFFHLIHKIYKTKYLPLRVSFCRLFTIYNFGAARNAEIPYKIPLSEPPPNMAITHRNTQKSIN